MPTSSVQIPGNVASTPVRKRDFREDEDFLYCSDERKGQIRDAAIQAVGYVDDARM